jgi:hypothetical protein
MRVATLIVLALIVAWLTAMAMNYHLEGKLFDDVPLPLNKPEAL